MRTPELNMGQKLKMFREINNLSQEELGQKLNVSDKTISAWETSERDISLPNAIIIAELFNIPKEYFVFNENFLKLSYDTQKQIFNYLEKQRYNYAMNKIIANCKNKIEKDGLPLKKEYMPKFDETDGKFVSFGIFNKDKLPIKSTNDNDIDNKNNYQYSSSALAKYNLTDVLERFNSDKVELKDLKDCNNLKVFKTTLERMRDRKYFTRSMLGQEVAVEPKKIIQEQLNYVLEYLNPELSNFYQIVLFLIENGAYYELLVGGGDDVVCWEKVKDTSKTNLAYRIAKDKVI